MHKGVTVRTNEAEDEVSLPQLLDNRPGRSAGLFEMQLIAQIVLD